MAHARWDDLSKTDSDTAVIDFTDTPTKWLRRRSNCEVACNLPAAAPLCSPTNRDNSDSVWELSVITE